MKMPGRIFDKCNRFINKNIGRKFAAYMIPLICGIMIVIAMVVSHMYSKDLIYAIEERTQYSVETMKINMDNYIDDVKQPLNTLSNNTSVKAMLNMDMENINYVDYLKNERNMKSIISSMIIPANNIQDLSIVGKNGYQYNMLSNLYADIMESEWFVKYVDKEETGFQYILPHNLDYYSEGKAPAGERVVSVLLPVKERGTILGYVIADIDMDRILRQPDVAEESGNFVTYLIDADKEYIYEVGEEKISLCEDQPFLEMLGDQENQTEVIGNDFFASSHMSSNGWYIVSAYLYEDIIASVRNIQHTVFAMMLVSCIAIYAVSRMMTGVIRKPISEIIKRMEDVEKQNFDTVIPDYRNQPGEIVLIRNKLEAMICQLNELINTVYMDEIYQKKMEYEQLVNQINPHFLYNVLQLIQSKAVLSDNNEINDIVVALSRLMRYNMSNQDKMVTVKEECDYVRNYLELYQQRYSGKFQYQVTIADGLADMHIIKFLVQPIVENCIKHGIKRLSRTGVIRVGVNPAGERICISVWDNGNGISKEKLDELRNSLRKEREKQGISIGIKNTYQRLRLTYGEQADMIIESEEDKYTEIRCFIPMEGKNV